MNVKGVFRFKIQHDGKTIADLKTMKLSDLNVLRKDLEDKFK